MVAVLHAEFNLFFFPRKEAEVAKFSLRRTEFLECSIIQLAKVNTVRGLSFSFLIGQDSAMLFPPPPRPNNGPAHSAQLLNSCQNFQVARQVQQSAGVCGGTNERAAQSPSTNQRPDFRTVLNKAILATFTVCKHKKTKENSVTYEEIKYLNILLI